MSMNVITLQERVHRRSGHVAVSYGASLLVWGGYMERLHESDDSGPITSECNYHYTDEIWKYDYDTEIWKRLLTSGDIPPPTCGSCGVVLGDSLYVFGGFCHGDTLHGNTNRLYRLDFTTLCWHLLDPAGQAPAACDKLAGWSYRDEVYFFGGFGPMPGVHLPLTFVSDPSTEQSGELRGWNNQLVVYEPHSNTWIWPKVGGEPPCPRAAHAADITGDKAYIFGGRFMMSRRNDLFCLDLSLLRWSPCIFRSRVPEGRSWHSFTFLSPDRAVIYGGLNNHNNILSDCWSMDVKRISAQPMWQPKCLLHDHQDLKPRGRFWHQAVVSPGKEMLSVVGGTTAPHDDLRYPKDHVEELLILDFTPKSLFRLSVDAVLKSVPVSHWFGLRCLPQGLEDTLLLRIEQDLSLPPLPSAAL